MIYQCIWGALCSNKAVSEHKIQPQDFHFFHSTGTHDDHRTSNLLYAPEVARKHANKSMLFGSASQQPQFTLSVPIPRSSAAPVHRDHVNLMWSIFWECYSQQLKKNSNRLKSPNHNNQHGRDTNNVFTTCFLLFFLYRPLSRWIPVP